MNGGDNRPHKGPRDFAEQAPPWGAPTNQGNGKLGRPAGHQANHPALTIGEPLVAVSKIRHTAGTGEHSRKIALSAARACKRRQGAGS